MSVGEAENQLPHYLLKDGNQKNDFSIKHVIEEASKILDCHSDIDADEIEDFHNMSEITKEIKEKSKEEQAAMDDPWINGVPVEKMDVDNQGNWPQYCYQSVFKKHGEYTSHSLPTNATPIPLEPDGTHKINDWEFFNNGCEDTTNSPAQYGATRTNLFLKNRRGSLDKNILQKLGLGVDTMKGKDALFFY
eukprot:1692864-Ditylum_brightwellii.AAC.1